MKKCKYFEKYKAIRPPKCGCKACADAYAAKQQLNTLEDEISELFYQIDDLEIKVEDRFKKAKRLLKKLPKSVVANDTPIFNY